MKKVVLCFMFLLAACSQKPVEELMIFKSVDFSSIKETPVVTLTDDEQIQTVIKAVKHAKKLPGVADVVEPDFEIKFGETTYFLWIGEEGGSVMNKRNSHTMYQLSDSSVSMLCDLLLVN